MKKLLGLGIFVLSFMLSVGMCFGTGYEGDMDPNTMTTWSQSGPMVTVETYVDKIPLSNNTAENKQYKSADVYLLRTINGTVLLAYTLYTVDGETLHYEMDVVTDTYVMVESLERPGFIERLESGITKKMEMMNKSTQ